LIAKIGSAAGLALFVALMIKFFVQLGKGVPHRLVYIFKVREKNLSLT